MSVYVCVCVCVSTPMAVIWYDMVSVDKGSFYMAAVVMRNQPNKSKLSLYQGRRTPI